MTNTQILAVGAPWIIAVIGFIAYLVWPKSPSRPKVRTAKNPDAMTLDEAISAIDRGLTVISSRRASELPASPRQKVPEGTSS